ncbi:MAG TPA: dUTP diphosphatase [Ignavibacteria bacterium]
MKLLYKKINPDIPGCKLVYSTEGSSGMDLSSASLEDVIIKPGETQLIPTNLIIEIPKGCEGQVRPRSGLALKYGITVLNSPGTIDCDYRGEVKVLLINHGKKDFSVKFGERIAQLIISTYEKVDIELEEYLSSTGRGSGGYGSTGI